MTTLTAGQSASFTIDAGQSLSIVSSANNEGSVTLAPTVPADVSDAGKFPIGPPAMTKTFGPYASAVAATVACTVGSLAYTLNGSPIVRATTDAVTGVVELSANGAVVPSVGPAFTWANVPAASLMAGKTVRVTDVGPAGAGSLWISNGTRWLPLNGMQLLSAKRTGTAASPLASVATVVKLPLPSADMVTSGSIVLPANLLSAGMSLHVEGRFRHTGTGGTWSAGFRLGTLDSGSDNSCAVTSGAATDDQTGWVFQEVMVLSSTSYASLYNTAPQGVSAAAISTRNTNFDTTAALYLAPYALSVNAADTVQLIAYEAWIKG